MALDSTLEIGPPTTAAEAAEAAEAARALQDLLDKVPAPARVVIKSEKGSSAPPVILPAALVALLREVLAQLANGNAVTVVPIDAELTTQQAAELLNVSRPYVVHLIETAQLPHRKVGTRRRVRFVDVMAYKKRDEDRRRRVLADLSAQAQDLDLGY